MPTGRQVVVRFAPSPTGNLHIGGVRTALYNFLHARKHGGTFILRIEDTDRARSRPEYERDILESLAWLGLSHDALFRQSERQAIYRSHIERLLGKDMAYVSEELKDGIASSVIRFRNPKKSVTFEDTLRGPIAEDTEDLGDFVIARDLDQPLYHLAAVIDDFETGVTHVIRGEDGISNTARQILLQESLQAPRPIYTHIPLILAKDRSKLSKRHGAVSASELKKEGYLPEAVINFLALLGWHPKGDMELFSINELIEEFSLERVQKGGAVFDTEKLKWLNREYLRKLDPTTFRKEAIEYVPKSLRESAKADRLSALLDSLRERISVFSEITTMGEAGELTYYVQKPVYDKSILLRESEEVKKVTLHLEKLGKILGSITPEQFNAKNIRESVMPYAEQEGRGKVLWPFRVALTGKIQSPDPFSICEILGKEESLLRLNEAQTYIE